MNYRLLCTLLFFFGIINGYSVRTQPNKRTTETSISDPVVMGRELFKTLTQKDSAPFQQLLEQAFKQFGTDKTKLKALFNTRNDQGLTLLMQVALVGDIENIIFILDRLKGYFGEDIDILYRYINLREPKRGRTALILSTYNRNVRVFKTLIEKFDALLNRDPELMFKVLSAQDLTYKLSALASVSFESSESNVKTIVQKAYERFGYDKPKFNAFINAKNGLGLTPLELSPSANIHYFLEKYGALKNSSLTPKSSFTDPLMQGIAFLRAVKGDDWLEAKRLLNNAVREYDSKAFFAFISRRNGDGWNALIDASVDSKKMRYIKLIINGMHKGLRKDKELMFDILNTVDINGKTALNWAIERKNYSVANFLLRSVYDVAGNSNNFFRFLNTPDELVGYTPLIQASYTSQEIDDESFKIIELMIRLAKNYLGSNSRSFDLFINARDYDNQSALDYSRNPQIIELLKKNGAIE